MPFDLKFPPSETIKLLANYLTNITSINDQRPPTARRVTRFHAKTIPQIDVLGYLTRILKYAPCGTECFLAILIYFERISPNNMLIFKDTEDQVATISKQLESTTLKGNKTIILDSYNIHRLIISASLISIKFLSDVFYTNLHISRRLYLTLGVGGLPVVELNGLELELLKLLDFSLYIGPDDLTTCGEKLLAYSHSHTLFDYIIERPIEAPMVSEITSESKGVNQSVVSSED